MAELRGRVRERLRTQMLEHGSAPELSDPALFAEVDAMLRRAADGADPAQLMLPELLGDPSTWRLNTAMHYQSHRSAGTASAILFLKRRVNYVLFACVQELALETARLRAEMRRAPRA